MTLKESISKAIEEFGKDVITEPRFVNILADYDAFAESRQMRMVVKEMIEQGFTKRILDADYSSVEVDETIGALVFEALNIFPFREDLISSFLSAVVRCLAEDEDNLVGKSLKKTSLEYFEISEDGKTLIEANGNLVGKVVIPTGIEVIGDCAFLENDSITEVYFPAGLKIIGTSAFGSCTKLRNIQLPSSLEIIEDSAFVGNECLTEVLIHNGVKKLGDAAFADCTNLIIVHLPESLEVIGSECFADCYKLTNILIPRNVHTIGHGLSYGEATVDPCNIYLKSVEGAILSKDGKVLYSVPGNRKNYTVPEGVVNLPMETFKYTEMLESVSLPKSLLFIQDGVFDGCRRLHRIEIQEGLHTIGPGAFRGCFCLEELVIPESVKSVGNRLFEYTGLKTVTFKSLDPENIDWFHLSHDDYDLGLNLYPFFYVPQSALEKYRKLDQFKSVILVPIFESNKADTISTLINDSHHSEYLSNNPARRGHGKITRSIPLLSIKNVKTNEEITQWMTKTSKQAGRYNYTVEWKYDGCAACLVYTHGLLTEASYGKGSKGMDFLELARLIPSIPNDISNKLLPDGITHIKDIPRLEVQGEVVVPYKHFPSRNADCRSAASSILADTKPGIFKAAKLLFLPYYTDLPFQKGQWPQFHHRLTVLQACGFHSDPTINFVNGLVVSTDNTEQLLKQLTKMRQYLPFPTDGLVFKLFDMSKWNSLGSTKKFYNYCLAYKLPVHNSEEGSST